MSTPGERVADALAEVAAGLAAIERQAHGPYPTHSGTVRGPAVARMLAAVRQASIAAQLVSKDREISR